MPPTLLEQAKKAPLLKSKPPRGVKSRKVLLKEKKFVRELMKPGISPRVAYERAFVPKEELADRNIDVSRHSAHTVLKRPSVIALLAQYEEMSLRGYKENVDKLAELRDTSKVEKIQLEAAKELLSTYHRAADRIITLERAKAEEPTATTQNLFLVNLSDEQLRERIAGLVSGAPQAEG
jgi:hypothetical protein